MLRNGSRIGRYTVASPLGVGGFGPVYVAHDDFGDEVAIKISDCEEIAMLSTISHPNVVRILDHGVTGERRWFAMERVFGCTLERWIDGRPRAPSSCIAFAREIAAALDALHVASIVHGDLSAANVVIRPDGHVVLIDFGLAHRARAPTCLASMGTPGTRAPEQLWSRVADPRIDVYALGALLFHMIAGRPMFAGHSLEQQRFLEQFARRPRLSDIAAVSPAIDEVLANATAIDPRRRFVTPRALVDAFADAAVTRYGSVMSAHTGK